ncbi:MAG: helix-turn-helix transcriptional regulator [Eubacteriales bacterium]
MEGGGIVSSLERQRKILIKIARQPGTTIQQLADEFEVTPRTIQRDIDSLCLTEPIYAVRGRYGGIFYTDNYYADWNAEQIDLMTKLLNSAIWTY